MTFFDPAPLRGSHGRRSRRTDAAGSRPTLLLPGLLDDVVELAQTDDLAVWIEAIACFPTGVAFTLRVSSPWTFSDDEPDAVDPASRAVVEDPAMRLGVTFADGRSAVVASPTAPDEDRRIALVTNSGGGTIGSSHAELWLQPLPPPGPVVFSVTWPIEQVPETLTTIDGQRLIDAAARAQPLFPT